ncbi:MAG: PA0069 family radical SAM protein [Proteobacteria bacterium]|nr:PA0069 family radical SAM protein [Pseudomonadota bacterium]
MNPDAPLDHAIPCHIGSQIDPERRRGRGAVSNASGRFERFSRTEEFDDRGEDEPPPFRTEVIMERAKSIITRNDSPDISFDRSINPYRGCEHGCSYCFARPSHTFLGLSAGLDFETKLYAKTGAAALLERELSAPGYQPRVIALGANTDPYQPVEKEHRITRSVLEVLARTNHPVGIVTKSALVTRDIDLLAPMAERGLVKVALSVTTLDRTLSRAMEPRAAAPGRRLATIRALSEAGIPVSVLVAPVIPAINDHEIERILESAREAGASEAGYVLLRLPHEVRDIFAEWLVTHAPDKARHVLSLVRSTRGGKDYDPKFFKRQSGDGPFAWMIGRRFSLAAERLGFAKRRLKLDTTLFRPPSTAGEQLNLFDVSEVAA